MEIELNTVKLEEEQCSSPDQITIELNSFETGQQDQNTLHVKVDYDDEGDGSEEDDEDDEEMDDTVHSFTGLWEGPDRYTKNSSVCVVRKPLCTRLESSHVVRTKRLTTEDSRWAKRRAREARPPLRMLREVVSDAPGENKLKRPGPFQAASKVASGSNLQTGQHWLKRAKPLNANLSDDLNVDMFPDKGSVACSFCGAQLSTILECNLHIEAQHKFEKASQEVSLQCLEDDCTVVPSTIYELKQHLCVYHNLDLSPKNFTFKTMDEFLCWKQDLESANGTRYRFFSCFSEVTGGTTRVYVCNNEGRYDMTRAKHQRRRRGRGGRIVGLRRVGRACPSQLLVRAWGWGAVEVTAILAHYGHCRDGLTLGLQLGLESSVGRRKTKGIDAGAVEESAAQTGAEEERRGDREDGVRIIEGALIGDRGMDDLQTDLAAWNLVDNVSICTCKRLQERDELGLVRPEDFVLGFTTSDQLELWADRGDRAICVDTSQVRMSGSPAQQETCVSVTAVLALGERGDACPVAWLLTSCYSEALLKHFFMCLQVAFESFHGRSVPVPRLLVCEATSPAQRLWQEVFKCSLTALQATWSTHKIWLPQLHRITDLDKRLQTWTRLCWISRTSDPRENEEEFVTLLESLASDEETLAFSLHLQQEWLPSLQPRGGRQMLEKRCQDAFSTGLYLDVLHSLLHFLFVEETFSLDYDECVAKLNCYSTAVLRAMKESPPAAVSVPGAPRCRASQLIATRHAEATTLGPDSVTPLRQHEWRVRCHKRPDVWYSVTRLAHKTKLGSLKSMCSAACTQACWQCEVCVHQYTCTCPDSTVLSTVCVHVHLIRILMRDPHHGSSAPAPAPCEPPGHLKDFRSNEKIKLELRSKCAALTALLAKCDPNNGLNGWSRERLLRCDHLLDEALTTLQDTEEAAPLLLQNDSVQVLYSCDANSSDVYTACGAQTDIYSNGDVGAGTEVQSVPLQTDYSNPQVLEDSGTHVLGEELSTVESLLVLHEENGRYSLVGGEAEELLQASVAKPGRGLLYLQRPGSAALTDADSTSADLLGEEPPVAEKALVLEGVSTCGELLSNC